MAGRDQRARVPARRPGVGDRGEPALTPLAAIETPSVDWLALSPSLALLAASAVALLAAVIVPRRVERTLTALVALAGFAAAGVLACVLYERTADGAPLLAESMTRDRFSALAQVLVAGAGALAVLVAWGDGRRSHVGEFYSLLAAAGAGMVFFVQAGNLMTIFLGLEWFSITLYVLTALDTHRRASLEAGLKYLVVGSFGSAVLLFGAALVYGATGELGLDAIREVDAAGEPLFVAGMGLILAGLAFKASAAPFHMWTPDVYEGAPTPVTAFMSAATKAAALVVLVRVLVTAFPEQAEVWTVAVAVLACASLAVGNLAALAQTSLKRLLAYSSISHAGFMLIAVAANNELGARALLFYLLPYAAGSIGAFAVVAARERELARPVTLEGMAGLGWERPFHGAAMWAFMLSAAGFPLTGGFLGKFYVFSAVYEAGWWWLIVVGVVATAVSVAYYLGVVRAMYMPAAADVHGGALAVAGGSPPADRALTLAIGASLAIVVGSFFAATPLFDLVRDAAAHLPL